MRHAELIIALAFMYAAAYGVFNGSVDCEDGVMLIAIWDLLFTRRIWTETERRDVFATRRGVQYRIGVWIFLKDQFGNVKVKKVR